MVDKKLYGLTYCLLFSGLGLFSYLLLLNYTNLPEGRSEALSSVWALLFVIAAFNILGFSIIRLSSWINRKSPLFLIKRKRIAGLYFLVALLLLLLNYGLLTTAKFLVGAEQPFIFPNAGVKILAIVWLVELVVVSLLLVNRSMQNTLKLTHKAAYLQEENNKARYIALQNQLNPHFLFNNLNTLIAEIEYNPHNAVNFTRNLSDVYRYVLQCQNQTLISLKEELDFIESYVFLHQVRLGNCIRIKNCLPESVMECKLPPLTLQLLVENVIKHNSISTHKPIEIVVEFDADTQKLVVSNPIQPKISQPYSGTGLQNLSNRYKLLIGQDIEVIENNEVFTVKVPLLYE